MFHFILGRAGSGKTEYVRKLIAEKLNNDEKNLILLVPEQFSFESEKQLLNSVGAKRLLNIEILSFTRLASNSLSGTAYSSMPRLDDGGKAVLLSLAVEQLGDKISVFKKHSSAYSGLSILLRFILETKQCEITPETILKASEKSKGVLSQKLNELSLIIEKYNSLVGEGYLDDFDLLDIAAEELFKSGFFKGKTVFLDAFTGFTAQEIRLIDVIFKHADEIYVSLCTPSIDGESEYSPFSFINDTARKIVTLANRNGVKIAENTVLTCTDETRFTNDLRFLEKHLYSEENIEYDKEPESITVSAFESRIDECRAVACEIKRLMREEGARCREIAVFQRENGTYDTALNYMFKKYEIPFYEDSRASVSANPLIIAVKLLLRIAERGLDTDTLLSLLKTDMTFVTPDEISEIESYCFVWSIRGVDWKNEWTNHPDGYSSVFSESEKKRLEKINDIRKRTYEPIETFRSIFRNADGQQKSEAVYNYLIQVGANEKLKQLAIYLQARGDSALSLELERVWNLLMNVLDSVASIAGQYKLTGARYAELFDIIISAQTLGSVPQGLDNVAVANAERSRLTSPKYLFVLGLNEGEFPKDSIGGGVITEGERRELIRGGLELLPACEDRFREERYIAYHALTSAKKHLYLSYNSGSADNGTDAPSEVIDNVREIFPLLKVHFEDNTHSIASVESRQSSLGALAASWHDGTDFSDNIKSFFKNDRDYAGVFSALERIADRKKCDLKIEDKQTAKDLFGNDLYFSASRVEQFFICPFKYFCRYGLKVNPMKKAQVDAALSGTIIHYCLEKMLSRHGRALKELTSAERREEIREILNEYAEENMYSNEGQSAKFIYNFNYHADIISRLLDRLCEEFEFSEFVPVGFEMKIGEDGEIKPYKIDVPDGSSVSISGFIDRVDLMQKNGKSYVRVVDYKSGVKDFKPKNIDLGLNCQMLIYLFALWKNGGDRFPDFVPSGVLYFRANDKFANVEGYMSEKDMTDEANSAKRMKGIVLNDDDVILSMDCTDSRVFIPAVTGSGRGRDGGKATLDEFVQFRETVENAIKDMALKLHDGFIGIYPVDDSDNYTNMCNKCDYAAICGIDDYDQSRTEAYDGGDGQ